MASWLVTMDYPTEDPECSVASAWLWHPEVARVVQCIPPSAKPVVDSSFHNRLEYRRCTHPDSATDIRAIILEATEMFWVHITTPGTTPNHLFFQRVAEISGATAAGGLFSWYYRQGDDGILERRVLPPFQMGSARDSFPLGPVQVLPIEPLQKILREKTAWVSDEHGGFFEIWLAMAHHLPVVSIPEPLYTVSSSRNLSQHDAHFAYLSADARAHQQATETIFSDYLKRIGAWLPPPCAPLPPPERHHPTIASVIIPVRNRCQTIGDAIQSALDQRTDFPFNVLVVDNLSSDGTTSVINGIAARDTRVVLLSPQIPGCGIGGCWQTAISDPHCGLYAMQLDSDDLYSGPDSLAMMVHCLRETRCGMAVGSYRIVNEALQDIPPGLIDHREWTAQNGHNNLLRVEGIGAPRAFYTPALRQVGFPDVSYGEDYAVALAMSRQWPVGRIFEPLYLCRRWTGNSDSNLTSAQQAMYHTYKDFLRTQEILVRQRLNAQAPH